MNILKIHGKLVSAAWELDEKMETQIGSTFELSEKISPIAKIEIEQGSKKELVFNLLRDTAFQKRLLYYILNTVKDMQKSKDIYADVFWKLSILPEKNLKKIESIETTLSD